MSDSGLPEPIRKEHRIGGTVYHLPGPQHGPMRSLGFLMAAWGVPFCTLGLAAIVYSFYVS